MATLSAPDYRGADNRKLYALPFPYMRYHGEKFKIDEDGVRQELFDSDRIRIDFSLAGNVPVGKSSGVRKDMPGLDPVGEIGPSLQYNAWKNSEKRRSLWLIAPLRAVFSSGDPLLDYRGIVFAPYAVFYQNLHYEKSLWKFSASAGPMFATQRYHNYFYGVRPSYATDTRSEYDATGGYSGSRLTLTLTMVSKKYWFSVFARYDNLTKATFDDSPLVETKDYVIGGFAMAWIFASSEQKAPH